MEQQEVKDQPQAPLPTNTPTSEELPRPGNEPTSSPAREESKLPRCSKCSKTIIVGRTLCYSCAFLPRFESFQWVTCPECGKEWNKLKDNGVCFDCDHAKYLKNEAQKRAETAFKAIFGSVKAMNYYTFQRFRSTPGNEEAFEACRDFNSSKDNLYLWGPCGTGKTHLGYATAKTYALNGRSVVIATPLKIVDAFRTKSDLEKDQRFDEYTTAELLLIDDLGISKYTDFGLEILCEILNRRTLQMRNGLIVTSNLDLGALAKRNGDDRLSSRLAGLCRAIKVEGTDFRLTR